MRLAHQTVDNPIAVLLVWSLQKGKIRAENERADFHYQRS